MATQPIDAAEVGEVRRACRELVRELGLLEPRHPVFDHTPTGGHALLELARAGRLRLADLGERLRLDKSTVSRALKSLAARGLVRGETERGDRRLKWFRLTARGRTAARRLDDWAQREAGTALERVAPPRRAELVRGVGAYVQALRRERARRESRVRVATAGDDAALLAVIRTVRIGMGAREAHHPVEEPEDRALHRTYAGPRARYFVALRAGSVVGGGGIAPLRGAAADTCELQRMYLLPEVRGLGLGAELLQRCLAAARAFGYRRCYLETLERLEPARRLYEAAGFRRLPAPEGETGHGHTDAWYALELVP